MSTIPTPPPIHRDPKTAAKYVGAGLGAIAFLAVGVSLGSGDHAAPAAAVATPAPTVTATVTKAQTPAACLEALSDADSLMSDYRSALNTVAPVLDAIQTGNVRAVNDATTQLNQLNPIVQNHLSAYSAAKSACKAAG